MFVALRDVEQKLVLLALANLAVGLETGRDLTGHIFDASGAPRPSAEEVAAMARCCRELGRRLMADVRAN